MFNFLIAFTCFFRLLFSRDFHIPENSIVVKDNFLYPCVVYSNHTSTIGCSAGHSGSSGRIYLISDDKDIKYLLSTENTQPLVLVFNPLYFTKMNLIKIEKFIEIAGVVILQSPTYFPNHQSQYSFESDCFNSRFDYYSSIDEYKNCQKINWNKNVEDLIERHYLYPMVAVKDDNIVKSILACNKEEHDELNDKANNSSYPLCGIQFDHFMFSRGMTTPICLRKYKSNGFDDQFFCDPIHAENIYATIYPSSTFKTPPRYIVVSVKLDVRSLFVGVDVGAEAELTALIVVLSMIHNLAAFSHKKEVQYLENRKNILFTFFDGESWDSVGSSRVAYDITGNKFSFIDGFNSKSIEAFIELGQVGLLSENKYWLHTDPVLMKDSDFNSKTTEIASKLIEQGNNLTPNLLISKVNSDLPNQPLPPCSYQQFLRHGLNIPGIVITGHKSEFLNKLYHGSYDDSKNLNINFETLDPKTNPMLNKFTSLSLALTKTLLLISGVNKDSLTLLDSPQEIVGNLAVCLLNQTDCNLFKKILPIPDQKKALSNSTFSRDAEFSTSYSSVILAFVGYSLGARFPKTSESCNMKKDPLLLSFMAENECILNATVYHKTVTSPYFDNPNEPMTNYSSWASSYYKTVQIKLYFIESPTTARNTMIIGVLTTAFTIIVSIIVKIKASHYITQV